MIIANFTPEEVEWKHQGISGIIKPGEVKEFDNARANHILNKWGQRGLLRLQYGDENKIPEKKAAALKQYKEFWLHQIVVFNRQNEMRKNGNRAFIFPPNGLEKKAEEFGVELIGPWKITPPADDKKLKSLEEDNRELRATLQQMQEQMKAQSAQMTTLMEYLADQASEAAQKEQKGSKKGK
jgi:hypothetical protein